MCMRAAELRTGAEASMDRHVTGRQTAPEFGTWFQSVY